MLRTVRLHNYVTTVPQNYEIGERDYRFRLPFFPFFFVFLPPLFPLRACRQCCALLPLPPPCALPVRLPLAVSAVYNYILKSYYCNVTLSLPSVEDCAAIFPSTQTHSPVHPLAA